MTTMKALLIALPLCLTCGLLGCASPCREFAGADWFRTAEVVDPAAASAKVDEDAVSRFNSRHMNRFSILESALDGIPSIPLIIDRRFDNLPTATADSIGADGGIHQFSLLIDTGAYRGGAGADDRGEDPGLIFSMSGELAKTLNAKLLPGASVFAAQDVAGRSVVTIALVDGIAISDIRIRNALASVDLGRVSTGFRQDGLLWIDFLRAFDVVIFDWNTRRVWLTRSDWADFDFCGWASVPMLNTNPRGPNLVSIQARFGDHTFPALLDTGATTTTVPAGIFDSLPDISPRQVTVHTHTVVTRGVVGRTARPIEIAGVTFRIRSIGRRERVFAHTDDGRPITGLIGMDVLRQRSFALDFRNNTVWFAPEGWRGPPKVAERAADGTNP